MTVNKHMTAEDLYLVEDDDCLHELIRGELIQIPFGSFQHSTIAARIGARIGTHVCALHLGIVTGANGGYVLGRDPDTVVAPDAAFVRADRLPEEFPTWLELAPDLVVEVIEPWDSMNDVTGKVMLYLDAGTQLVWVVQPRFQTVTVHYPDRTTRTFTAAEQLDGGDVLPGFTLSLAELFS